MSFVGGALKLKGGETLQGGVKKKKKKQAAAITSPSEPVKDAAGTSAADGARAGSKGETTKDLKKILHGYELDNQDVEDKRTEAEKRFEARQIQLEADRLKKLAGKSHRDRVKDFNDYLAKLSEHHDIPRVGPG